jgi:tetratricopeptide (TPR) repeat protein
MGFRVRKSFKVMPGVRMTVTPRGVSASVGVRGNRVTVNSRGRVTRTVGVPGTGISYITSSGERRGRLGKAPSTAGASSSAGAHTAPAAAKAPGFFAPKWEKVLFKVLAASDFASLQRVARDHPEARSICMLLDAFMSDGRDDARDKAILGDLWASGYDPAAERFLMTYAPRSVGTVKLAPGVEATMPLTRELIGLALAELRQEGGDIVGAVEIVELLEPSVPAAVSLAELYIAQGRWDEVIDLTNGTAGSDDFSCFLLAQRGVAFREKGYYQAAREAFKAALARRSQPAELKHHTLVERAMTYQREGKRSMARRDLERILAVDPDYPRLVEMLSALG